MQFNLSNLIDAIDISVSLTGIFLSRKNKEMKEKKFNLVCGKDVYNNPFRVFSRELLGYSVEENDRGIITYKLLLKYGHEIKGLSLATAQEAMNIAEKC